MLFLSPSYSFSTFWYRSPHLMVLPGGQSTRWPGFLKIPYSSMAHSIMAFTFWSKVSLPKVPLSQSWWIACPPSHPFSHSSPQNQTCPQCYDMSSTATRWLQPLKIHMYFVENVNEKENSLVLLLVFWPFLVSSPGESKRSPRSSLKEQGLSVSSRLYTLAGPG